MVNPKPFINLAATRHSASVIFSHGLGDTGAGWSKLAETYRSQHKFEEVKFIFPNAEKKAVTVQGGAVMPAWYDIRAFGDLSAGQDIEGILASRAYLHSLVKSEMDSGIPSERVVLVGFSQGGSISMFSGVTSPYKLGGVFGMSCFLLLSNDYLDYVPKESLDANKETPIVLAHGDRDQIVKPERARLAEEILKRDGWNVELKMYPGGGHGNNPQALLDLEVFLTRTIPPLGEKAEAQS